MSPADPSTCAHAPSPFNMIGPALLAAGYSPIPIRPDAKSPGEFTLAGEWTNKSKWQRWCREAPGAAYVERWSTWPNANVGVCCGRGLVAFDIDSDEHVAPILSRLPPVVVAKRGRKGLTVFFRGDTDTIRSRGFRIRKDGERLGVMDLIADGKQTVIPPSIHPDTHEPYVWTTERTLADTSLEELTECTIQHFNAVEEYLSAIGCETDDRQVEPLASSHEKSFNDSGDAFRDLNNQALASLSVWVPKLGLSRFIKKAGGYRAVAEWRPSYSGKTLAKREYHVSFNPKGIKDFGDCEKGYTPINLVMAAKSMTFDDATAWLRETLGYSFAPTIVLNRTPRPPGHVKPQRPARVTAQPIASAPEKPIQANDDIFPGDLPMPSSSALPAALPKSTAFAGKPLYPVDALGGVLGSAATAIARKIQVPFETAANSVLAVASLAAQGLADVRLPYGQSRPLSLFVITVAQSGDRKSTADNEAMAPVRIREERLREIFDAEQKKHDVRAAAWRADHDAIKRQKQTSPGLRAAEFERLGPQPEPPLYPMLTTPDATHEGLNDNMPRLPGSFGIFSDEGAKILGGHGFTAENKASTAANLSSYWDTGGSRRMRKGSGVTDYRGRRIAIHLMIQPHIAAEVAADPALRGQGLLARCLFSAPKTLAGSRLWTEPRQEDAKIINRYTARIISLLEAHPEGNELSPRLIELDGEAREAWIEFHDEVEMEQAHGGRSQEFRDVAGKAAEQAARIAGVLTIFDDINATEIDGDTMLRACALMRWYLSEAIRFFGEAEAASTATESDVLREWLTKTGHTSVSLREITRCGPAILRKPAARRAAIETLEASGHLILEATSRWRIAA